jgi:hypothetical protein
VPRLGLPKGARPSGSACNGAMARREDLTPRMADMVPGVGFEPTSPRLHRGAFTRLASQAIRIGAADRNRTCVCAVAPHGSAIELRTRAQSRTRTCEAKRHLIYSQASLPLEYLCVIGRAGDLGIARTYVGGRLTVRTPHLAVSTRFQDGVPATPAEPSNFLDVSARFERATSTFGRRRSDPLSYETKLGLELRVPVEVVHPALVQIAGWKAPLGRKQLVERRLLR